VSFLNNLLSIAVRSRANIIAQSAVLDKGRVAQQGASGPS
jgi:hypothetical protein